MKTPSVIPAEIEILPAEVGSAVPAMFVTLYAMVTQQITELGPQFIAFEDVYLENGHLIVAN